MRLLGLAFTMLAVVLASCQVLAEPVPGNRTWDRIAHVKEVTARLITMHRQRGSEGVTKFLGECYRTHRLASAYTQGLEGCIVQDYVHTQVLALVYSRIPPEAWKTMKAPTVLELAEGMSRRFNVVFSQYNIPEAEANSLKIVMDKHGLPMFVASVFPKGAPSAPKSP